MKLIFIRELNTITGIDDKTYSIWSYYNKNLYILGGIALEFNQSRHEFEKSMSKCCIFKDREWLQRIFKNKYK
jgi:hypothetical protein